MESRITATELVRRLGDVLSRIKYRQESFIVERNGTAVAKLLPVNTASPGRLDDALTAWRRAALPDHALAADLERIGAVDRAPGNPWD